MEVYLPNDEWIHLWTGNKYLGSNNVKIKCPIGYPPVFYRSKSKYHNLFESITQKYHYWGDVYEKSRDLQIL